MALDPSVQIAITSVAGLAVTGAIGIVGTIVTRKLDQAADERKEAAYMRVAAEKEVNQKVDHLTVLSNSNLSTTTERLNEAMSQIKALTELMATQQIEAKDELVAVKTEAQDKLVAEMQRPTTVPIAQAAEQIADALNMPIPAGPLHKSELPLPVTDAASERAADALERTAIAAEKAAEKKP